MTRHPYTHRHFKSVSGPPIPRSLLCDRCGAVASERHHIIPRSLLGGPSDWVLNEVTNTILPNVADLCSSCHRLLTEGEIVWDAEVSFELPREDAGPPSPGESCKSCGRRVPYPKKSDSPKTKVCSIRVPIDDVEYFEERFKFVAEDLGIYKKPHWKWGVINYLFVIYLQRK